MNIRNPFLEDYILQTNDLYIKLFSIFIQKLGSKLELKSQNQKRASYYSRLYTEINGAIDWNWSNVEIESFINAFGSPYPGAFTFLNNKKISILEGKSEKSKKYFAHILLKIKIPFSEFSGKNAQIKAAGLFSVSCFLKTRFLCFIPFRKKCKFWNFQKLTNF